MAIKERLRLAIRGAVQGVGFRPFVYRLATELGLVGWVNNSPQGVFIEVEGESNLYEILISRLQNEKPPRSFIQSLEQTYLDPVGFNGFEVRASEQGGEKNALVMPDIATCPDCLAEIFDKDNRRFGYPFTNCTNCGPRYTIIEKLPYDRANTTMSNFPMCHRCREEYENPLNRRFHAQPNACPDCGPQIELWDTKGKVLNTKDNALNTACAAITDGKIVAVKGIGGFHIMVDSRNEAAVNRLRKLKGREEKPLALMFPSLDDIKNICAVSQIEERLLLSPEAPIVLLERKSDGDIANSVAPDNPYLGVMLPYSPLHHLLMTKLGFAVVATSGNLSDEPICIDETEAVNRLSGIVDLLLVHNRPIRRHVDDSIVRVVAGRELVLRRARGFAPLPIELSGDMPRVLAVGAHLKNTVAISFGKQAVISQHIGDLETTQAYDAFLNVRDSLSNLYDFTPELAACDLHPDYLSTKYADSLGLPIIAVQHHYAHILSCMAENQLTGDILGISWDGTGYGFDKTIWGGEFLKVTDNGYSRIGHLRTFRLPGGEKAVAEPRRVAIGLLYEIYGDNLFSMLSLAPLKSLIGDEKAVLADMLHRKLNSPVTSSAGRLFDAVSSLIGIRQFTRYEGQAAMELEFAIDKNRCDDSYPFEIKQNGDINIIDWEQTIRYIIDDVESQVSTGLISAKFHNTMAEIMVEMARKAGIERVALSGGCFQNKYLTERAIKRLNDAGFRPYTHQRIPPNDGGIALGQIMAAGRQRKES
jgi:hydrogenase maturation protein HypF